MSKRIFRAICLVAFLVLIISASLTVGVLYTHFEGELNEEMKSEVKTYAYIMEESGIDSLKGLPDTGKRITVIASNGVVLYDNTVDDISSMDNHLGREEVSEALQYGFGESSRYSTTIAEKTVYYAVKTSDGNIMRLSDTQYSLFTIAMGTLQPIIVIIFIMLALSAFFAYRAAKSIVAPINGIDLENPEDGKIYEELAPLVTKISRQNRTIREQLDEAKRKQDEFLVITENMLEGLILIDNKTNIITCNSAAKRLLNSDVPYEHCCVLILNRTTEFSSCVEKALLGEHCTQVLENDGRFCRLVADPVKNKDKVVGAVIVILDITETAKREELRREFTANVSHELKTPLTSIAGFAELMKYGMVKPEDIKDFSESIYDEAQRLITLVNDILNLSALDEGGLSDEKERVDLFDLSGDILKSLKIPAEKKNITLELHGKNTAVMGSRKVLREMIFNLCDNGIKYNTDGGKVSVDVFDDKGHPKVVVSDNGIGIPKADQQRVFERFYRVDKSHSREIGGTGLGLSIVKHGALYHNADISLESEPGKGTSVTITFPKE